MSQTNQVQEDLATFQLKNVTIDLIFRGYIEDIEGEDIFVHLTDITQQYTHNTEPNEDLIASVSREQFPQDAKLDVGTIFYMYLGKTIGDKEVHEIILSRAVWTSEMIAKAKEEADEMYEFFNAQK